jgi:hypothetical protein
MVSKKGDGWSEIQFYNIVIKFFFISYFWDVFKKIIFPSTKFSTLMFSSA